eukprot:jgi/Mesvir1/11912/Mv00252-RA.1
MEQTAAVPFLASLSHTVRKDMCYLMTFVQDKGGGVHAIEPGSMRGFFVLKGNVTVETRSEALVGDAALEAPGDEEEENATHNKKHTRSESQHSTSKRQADLQQCFDFLDEDGSGALDAKELYNALRDIGIRISYAEVEALVNSVDEDGSGEIEFEEFCAIMETILDRGKPSVWKRQLVPPAPAVTHGRGRLRGGHEGAGKGNVLGGPPASNQPDFIWVRTFGVGEYFGDDLLHPDFNKLACRMVFDENTELIAFSKEHYAIANGPGFDTPLTEKTNCLKACPLFEQIPEPRALAFHLEKLVLLRHAMVIQENAPADAMYLIGAGECKVLREMPAADTAAASTLLAKTAPCLKKKEPTRQAEVAVMVAGGHFGALDVLGSGHYSSSVKVFSHQATLFKLPREHLVECSSNRHFKAQLAATEEREAWRTGVSTERSKRRISLELDMRTADVNAASAALARELAELGAERPLLSTLAAVEKWKRRSGIDHSPSGTNSDSRHRNGATHDDSGTRTASSSPGSRALTSRACSRKVRHTYAEGDEATRLFRDGGASRPGTPHMGGTPRAGSPLLVTDLTSRSARNSPVMWGNGPGDEEPPGSLAAFRLGVPDSPSANGGGGSAMHLPAIPTSPSASSNASNSRPNRATAMAELIGSRRWARATGESGNGNGAAYVTSPLSPTSPPAQQANGFGQGKGGGEARDTPDGAARISPVPSSGHLRDGGGAGTLANGGSASLLSLPADFGAYGGYDWIGHGGALGGGGGSEGGGGENGRSSPAQFHDEGTEIVRQMFASMPVHQMMSTAGRSQAIFGLYDIDPADMPFSGREAYYASLPGAKAPPDFSAAHDMLAEVQQSGRASVLSMLKNAPGGATRESSSDRSAHEGGGGGDAGTSVHGESYVGDDNDDGGLREGRWARYGFGSPSPKKGPRPDWRPPPGKCLPEIISGGPGQVKTKTGYLSNGVGEGVWLERPPENVGRDAMGRALTEPTLVVRDEDRTAQVVGTSTGTLGCRRAYTSLGFHPETPSASREGGGSPVDMSSLPPLVTRGRKPGRASLDGKKGGEETPPALLSPPRSATALSRSYAYASSNSSPRGNWSMGSAPELDAPVTSASEPTWVNLSSAVMDLVTSGNVTWSQPGLDWDDGGDASGLSQVSTYSMPPLVGACGDADRRKPIPVQLARRLAIVDEPA